MSVHRAKRQATRRVQSASRGEGVYEYPRGPVEAQNVIRAEGIIRDIEVAIGAEGKALRKGQAAAGSEDADERTGIVVVAQYLIG